MNISYITANFNTFYQTAMQSIVMDLCTCNDHSNDLYNMLDGCAFE